MKEKLSLYELNCKVRDLVKSSFQNPVWVVAEINELSVNNRGHCYLELIEKDPSNDTILARSRGTIWAGTFRSLKSFFETTTGRRFSTGLKVLILARADFHELYGFSLNIKDIDPAYTLGDLAKQRKETIDKLKAEGVFSMNRELDFPVLPNRIALISSRTAAGYEDFVKQLIHNQFGYGFRVTLFQVLLQGAEASGSIINALDEIYGRENEFDVVVIVRGGGSQADLSVFDDYSLTSHLAQFPLPVLTGIGHERDESIADMVSSKTLKTPTAVAEYLVARLYDLEAYTNSLSSGILDGINNILITEAGVIESLSTGLKMTVQNLIHENAYLLGQTITQLKHQIMLYMRDQDQLLKNMKTQIQNLFDATQNSRLYYLRKISVNLEHKCLQFIGIQNHKLQMYDKSISLLDPELVLQRGYSITSQHGKAIKNVHDLDPGSPIHTRYANGTSISDIREIKSSNKKLS